MSDAGPGPSLRRCLAALVVAALVTSQAAVWGAQAEPQGKIFPMKYETGTEAIAPDTKMKLTVGPEFIVCESKDGEVFTIPVAGVREVAYDIVARRRSEDVLPCGGLAERAFPLVLIAAAVAHPFKTKQHFVHVVWQEDGDEKEVWFKVGKGEYSDFLLALEQATGLRWRNRAQEREGLEADLREKTEKFSLRLDRKVWMNGMKLKPGSYQAGLIDYGNGQGELYLYRGARLEAKNLKGAALVAVVSESNELVAPKATYRDLGGFFALSEILLPTKTLRVQ